jgi:hypothetical protein
MKQSCSLESSLALLLAHHILGLYIIANPVFNLSQITKVFIQHSSKPMQYNIKNNDALREEYRSEVSLPATPERVQVIA